MDKNKVIMIAVGTGVLGLLVGLAASSFHYGRGNNNHDIKRDDKGGMMDKKQRGEMQNGQNSKPMDHSSMNHGGMVIESEREFIMGMIPHHEEAISSAKDVLARGATTPEIKTLAENIIKAQEGEVTQLKEWYKNWYGADYVADGTYKPMMQDTASLSGTELDRAFLTDMIPHHQMAIMMAQSVDMHIEHNEIKLLSANIKSTQTAEIEIMKKMLQTLN